MRYERDIKFRGKVKHHDPMTNPENGWVEGFYYQDLVGGEIKHFIKCAEMDWEIIPETLGQFTGVYDKYGKEVYEGDMLYIKEYDNVAFGESEEFKNAFDLEELKGELKAKYEGVVKWEDGDMYVEMPTFSLYMGTLFGNQKNSQPIFDFYITGNIHEGEC